MTTTPHAAIVVAVGTDGYDAAVTFAVAEARRTRRPVHLVHVLESFAAYSYSGDSGILDAARTTLDEATAAAGLAAPDVTVTAELVDHGSIVDDLVLRSDGASMLVLQHRALGRTARVLAGSTVNGVAGRAPVPVVSVPEGWTPDPPLGVVTAAVQDAVEAPDLLRAAFVEAEARDARLVVLHAWWLSSGYDVVVVDDAMRDEYSTRFRQELDRVLAPLRTEFPRVDVEVLVRHAPRSEAVLDAADASDLLVLGRRHHLLPLGSHLGPVARAALDHATHPVLITPEASPVSDEVPYSARLAAVGHHEPTT